MFKVDRAESATSSSPLSVHTEDVASSSCPTLNFGGCINSQIKLKTSPCRFSIRRSPGSPGLAVIEFAVCLPLFIILLIAVFDLAVGIDIYYRYIEVVRDAAALGARLDGMATGTACSTRTEFTANGIVLSPGAAGCADARHLLMHDRALTLASLLPRKASALEVQSTVNPATGSSALPTVTFSVRAFYLPIVLLYQGAVTIHAQVTAPLIQNAGNLALTSADQKILLQQFDLDGCSPPEAGTVLSQGLLINLAEADCGERGDDR